MQNCITMHSYAPLEEANKLIMDDTYGIEEQVNWVSHKQMMLTQINSKGLYTHLEHHQRIRGAG